MKIRITFEVDRATREHLARFHGRAGVASREEVRREINTVVDAHWDTITPTDDREEAKP